MPIIERGLLIALTILVAGCNTVAYHHSERFGIAIEVKETDPAQPVQGHVALKTRTVLVTPQAAEGEAASVISDFRLTRKPSGLFGQTLIHSAFLTGDAAANAPASTIAVLGGGLASTAIGSDASIAQKQIMRNIYKSLEALEAEGDTTAGDHKVRLDKLAGLVPGTPPKPYYVLKGKRPNEKLTLKPAKYGTSSGFLLALKYLALLDTSIASIQSTESERTVTTENGAIDEKGVIRLVEEKAQLKKERRNFAAEIGGSPAFDAAASYVISQI